MALKTTLDSDAFGELDESMKGLYQESDNGYVLDVEGIDEHPSVAALKSGHKRSKDERKQYKDAADSLRRKLGALADEEDIDLSDIDPERLTELRPYLTGEAELPKAGDNGGGGKTPEELEKIRQNARKPLERDLAAANEKAEKWQGIARKTLVHNSLASEFSRAGVKDQDFLDLLIDRYASKCRIDVDEGNAAVLIDSEYGEVSPKEFAKEWSGTDYAKKFIAAANNSGGGANGGASNAKVNNPWSAENWNMSEQARVYREDPERAQRMAAEHGKKVGTAA